MLKIYHLQDNVTLAQHYQTLLTPTSELIACDQPFKNKWLKHLPQNEPVLLLDQKGLWLALNSLAQPLKIQPDWLAQQRRVVNAGKKSELLLKAAKITPNMKIIDATAGLGHDSILMAGRGAHVTLLEAQPIMHALLSDAMRIISEQPNWHALHQRLTLAHTTAQEHLQNISHHVDLVYLDPMFPDDSYRSAQVNKNMQLLHHIAKPPSASEEAELLAAARHAGKRVIVKRPRHAPFLAGQATDMQWQGDTVRFDAYTN